MERNSAAKKARLSVEQKKPLMVQALELGLAMELAQALGLESERLLAEGSVRLSGLTKVQGWALELAQLLGSGSE